MNRLLKFLVKIIMVFMITSCTQVTDLSKQEPYVVAIGKHFVLQKNLYIYEFNEPGSLLRIGDINNMSNSSVGIPKIVDKKYIGTKGQYITLKQIAIKGTLITIKSILRKQTLEDSDCIYNIIINNELNFLNQEINSSDILNLNNPPYVQYWSDPPIFNSEYALPLPSDGIWWK